MKIKLLSDLHLEGHKFTYTDDGEDVVILNGDIHTRCRHEQIIEDIPATKRIIFVAGNHEYYHQEFHEVNRYFKSLEEEYGNFTWLNDSGIDVGNVSFFGGTMFTDFLLNGEGSKPIAMVQAQLGINDFRTIDIEHDAGYIRRWNPTDHVIYHEKFVRALEVWLNRPTELVRCVVSHFAPSPATINPIYAGSALNPYFTSDMTRFMGWEGCWLFGHTHSSVDIMHESTRIVSNPKGYGKENAEQFNPNMILEM